MDSAHLPEHRVSVAQRGDGAVVVRVHSEEHGGHRLPDAVFAFRCGDPQYAYWLSRVGTTALETSDGQATPSPGTSSRRQ